MKTSIISMVSELEAESSQNMCEIRFDGVVSMYKAGYRKQKSNIFIKEMKPQSPQWFKSTGTLTLEAIKDTNPYLIGRYIQDMYEQLVRHIEQYEKH